MALVQLSSKSAAIGAAIAAVVSVALLIAAQPQRLSVPALGWLMITVNKAEAIIILAIGLVAIALRRWASRKVHNVAILSLLASVLALGGQRILEACQTFEPEPYRLWWWQAMFSTLAFAEAPFFLSMSLVGIAASYWVKPRTAPDQVV